MRVCLVTEGCYPYVAGGVSSWAHTMIKAFPDVEFVILGIIADRSVSARFVYELPENVVEVHEIYLNDSDWGPKSRFELTDDVRWALRSLVLGTDVDWEGVFDYFATARPSINDLVMGKDFYDIVKRYYDESYPRINFTDFLWTMRSMYLPLFQVLNSDVPAADIYHCVATGYAGIAGCMARHLHGGSLLLSEHGIYTREREEELIRAEWLEGFYKSIWIDHFKKMSLATYERADIVTSLFAQARELQRGLGCPEDKQVVTPNGIDHAAFADVPTKEEDDGFVDVGAFVRLTPIKDIKTMIQAFALARHLVPNLRLWVMGPDDEDAEYAAECHRYVEHLHLEGIQFTGRIRTADYLGKMDITLLTSISEGQPLVILEGFAAGKPAIATDVGNCSGLILGEDEDDLGAAGMVCHVMNVDELAHAIVELATHPEMRVEMGRIGHERLMRKYTLARMQRTYRELYARLAGRVGASWQA